MTPSLSGWRTRHSHARTRGLPYPALAPGAQPVAAPGAAYVLPDDRAVGMPWSGVPWSLSMVGLMVYLWTVVTYAIALAQPGMVVALLGLFLLDKPLRLPPYLALFGAWIFWSCAGLFLSPHPERVSAGVEDMAKVWLIALVVTNVLQGRKEQRWFMFFFLAAFALYPTRGALLNSLFGLSIQGRTFWNYIYRNPNDLAGLTLMQIGLAAGFLMREPKGWPRLAALVGCAVLPLVVLLTASRGAFIGLVLFGLFVLARQPRQTRVRAMWGVAAVAVVAALFAPSTVWERVKGLRGVTDTENLQNVDSSAEQRFEIWKVARVIIADNPITGVGLRAYPLEHGIRSVESRFRPTARGERDAHSTYLTVLAETGVPGFLLWGGMLVAAIGHAEATRRRARDVLPNSALQIVYLELGIVAFLIAGLFGSYAHLAFTAVHLAILWTVSDTVRAEVEALRAGGWQAAPATGMGGALAAAPRPGERGAGRLAGGRMLPPAVG